ncbi:MAG TPA: DinB family protein [Dehalococcoidia bacterium]
MTASIDDLERIIATDARDAIRCLAAAERAVEEGRLNIAKLLRSQALAARQRALILERLVARSTPSTDIVVALRREQRSAVAALEHATDETGRDVANVALRSLRASLGLLDKTLTALEQERDVPERVVSQFLWGCNDCGFIVESNRPEVCASCGSMGGDFEMFAPFFSSTAERIARKQPAEIVVLLRGHATQLADAFAGADDNLLRRSPAEGEWCMKEIAGHMVDIAEIFARRVRPVVDPTAVDVDEGIVLPWKILDGKAYPLMSGEALTELFAAALDDALAIIERLTDADWRNRRRWLVGSVSVLDMASWLANHNTAHLGQIRARREELERTSA